MSRRAVALLLATGLLIWSAAACAPAEEAPQTRDVARYVALPIQTGSGMEYFRFDTATGALVRAALMGGRSWQPVGDTPPPDPVGPYPGRYSFEVAASPSLPLTLLRLDTPTGRAWRLHYKRGKKWIAFREQDEATPAPRARRPAQAAPSSSPARSAVDPTPVAPAGADGLTPQQRSDLEQLELAVDSEFFRSEDRAWAVEEIAKLPRAAAVLGILHSLKSDDEQVLTVAAMKAGSLGIAQAVPRLEALSSHESAGVQKAAKRSLRRIGR